MKSAAQSAPQKLLPALFALLLAVLFNVQLRAVDEPTPAPLPAPVSNNAVAISHDQGSPKIFSFMGIGPKKTWDAITTATYELDLATGKWTEEHPVPGVAGRLAASAVALHDQVFIFGGYIVDSQGGEHTVPDLNVFVPAENRYYRGKDMPVPVDDAVVGLYRDRYIFVIGGWSSAEGPTGGPVRNVQIYDTDTDTWLQATPIPGTPVFGHAGAIVGDTIVYVDGAYKNPYGGSPKFVSSRECWMGKIPTSRKADITKIDWFNLPVHPGAARYRIAAGAGLSEKKDSHVYFTGGTDTPYNYNGIGYNGRPAEPSPVTFAFNAATEEWETIEANPDATPGPASNVPTPTPTMDHRGLLVTPSGLIIVGGMEKGQKVTDKVTVVKLPVKK
jgi:N-acetylneuraminic acid mutarotase